ncbi:FtsX-like permease family protein [Nocardioides conyzicola]|uniref:ABC3 transporter permease C-terminal domain-containing protein n=1 Tax=Nocardioides conyzicola TaxID=1651781 RepID=A0ABP8Y1K1_9ACTN
MRTDPGPLVLIAVVVALTTSLLAAAGPLTERASDRALADAVRRAGAQGAVVGTFDRGDVFYDTRARDPRAAAKLRAAVSGAQRLLPQRVARVVQPGTTSATSTPLQLLDAGPGRYLTLAYLDGPAGPPGVRYVSGGPPRPTVGAGRAGTELPADAVWTVQVSLSRAAAKALGLRPGDRLPMKDQQARPVSALVSGVFVARDPGERTWLPVPELLHPVQGVSAGVRTASAGALVSAAALPDLQLALPADGLTERIYATPRPDAVRWSDSDELLRAIGSLKAAPQVPGGAVWDSELDRVLEDGRSQVAVARGQADVLLLSLLVCALLVLWLAAELLVRRRAPSVLLTRERGGTLAEIAAELFIEAAGWVLAGVLVGVLGAWLVTGDAGWSWWFMVPFLAAAAAGARGAALSSRATDPRRTPANRNARRVLARGRQLRRAVAVAAVVAAAALSFLALRQRGVVGEGGDLTAAGAPVWWAVAGALLVVAGVPALAGLLLDATRRSSGAVAFFVAARVRETGARALPLLVITVTVAQLTFAIALTSTEQRGQAAGALLSVGGDARATLSPGRPNAQLVPALEAAPGVRAAVAARIDDLVPATSRTSADTVLLTVVDAAAYERLLAASALPDAPQLGRLVRGDGAGVPALVLGGPAGLRDGFSVRSSGGPAVKLTVVGTAPRVRDTVEPVVVVDAATYARAGGVAEPDTVWAVGPGAASALRAQAGPGDAVVVYADELAARRAAPLVKVLVGLALGASALLLLFALLGVVMMAASEAGPRASSLGRLRALGLRDRQLRSVLGGELAAPVLVGALAGLALGLGAAVVMFGQLSLESVTGQASAPSVSVPVWVLVGPACLVGAVVVLTSVEWTRLRRVALGQLLRGGQ